MGSFIAGIEPCEFAQLVSLFAIALSDGLSPDEATSLGTFFSAVGDTVQLIGAPQALAAGNTANVCPGGET